MSRSSDLPAPRLESDTGEAASGAAAHAIDAYRLEFDYLSRTLARLGAAAVDVEDLAHQVFLVLHRKWPEYDPKRPLRPYLFGIAFRVVAAHRRQRQREVSLELDELVSPTPQPDQLLSNARARQVVLQALGHVALPRRAVLILHDLDEIPMRTIADALEIPLFTAYSRLRKARKEFESAVRALRGGLR